MTLRPIWGSLPILLSVLTVAHANPGSFPIAASETVNADSIEFLDPLNELPLTDLFPRAAGIIKLFRREPRSDEILRKAMSPDLHDYLLAYKDYSLGSGVQFVNTVSRPEATHTYIFKLAAVKILIAHNRGGRKLEANVSNIYRSIPLQKANSSLGYVLQAEDALVCAEGGLPLARTSYQACVEKYPEIPSLRNREAYLFESAGGVFTGAAHRSGQHDVVTPSNLKVAIRIRKEIRKRFPHYEPNYYYLAGDYRTTKQPKDERAVLRDYFKLFGSKSSYYGRCKAMAGQPG